MSTPDPNSSIAVTPSPVVAPTPAPVNTLKTPDVTPVQIISAVGAVVGLLVGNLFISAKIGKEITDVASIVIPSVFAVADAIIRNGRAKVAASLNR